MAVNGEKLPYKVGECNEYRDTAAGINKYNG